MDRKEVTALVLLDLSKAFDSIQRKSLLKKKNCVRLESLGTPLNGLEAILKTQKSVSEN